jgi:preprotein translocase subunit SecY
LGLLLIYRIGCWLPVPGIMLQSFSEAIGGQDFLSLISSISGGALSQGAILSLGISPYISASIIIQLLTIAIPFYF